MYDFSEHVWPEDDTREAMGICGQPEVSMVVYRPHADVALQLAGKHDTVNQCRFNVGPPSATAAQHKIGIGLRVVLSGWPGQMKRQDEAWLTPVTGQLMAKENTHTTSDHIISDA